MLDYQKLIGDSDTTSLNSSMYSGYIQHGRRYQSIFENKDRILCPSDEQQFESMGATHLLYAVLDSQEANPLFRSPIPDNAQNIVDLGTGNGAWAIDVAERYPTATVRGVDLYPPPQSWMPANCYLEVDDITQPWTWSEKFDLIHVRCILGSVTAEETEALYKQAFEKLAPGGWIEQLEPEVKISCDDGTLPDDAALHVMGKELMAAAEAAGKPLDTYSHMRSRIEAAGFTNIHEKNYKGPIGAWPKHPIYKDAGRIKAFEFQQGIEGWCIYLLTHFGENPWTAEQVQAWAAKVKSEIDSRKYHVYQRARRVYAQKPY